VVQSEVQSEVQRCRCGDCAGMQGWSGAEVSGLSAGAEVVRCRCWCRGIDTEVLRCCKRTDVQERRR